MSRALAALKRAAPYVVAAAALGWVLVHTDARASLAAVQRAPVGAFLALSLALLTANWALDTFAMGAVLRRFGHAVPFRELLVVRGATYLLAVVNYHVGQAALLAYLYRAHRVPLARAGGVIVFIMGVNLGTLFVLASAGALAARGALPALALLPAVCALGVIAYAALLRARPRLLTARRLLAPLFEMGLAGHARGVLVRLPHIANLLVWQWLCLRLFGFRIPAWQALVYLPTYFAVSALPLNVNGVGVAQLAAVAFFARFAPVPADAVDPVAAQRAAVVAWSLSVQAVSLAYQLVVGALCVRAAAGRSAVQGRSAP